MEQKSTLLQLPPYNCSQSLYVDIVTAVVLSESAQLDDRPLHGKRRPNDWLPSATLTSKFVTSVTNFERNFYRLFQIWTPKQLTTKSLSYTLLYIIIIIIIIIIFSGSAAQRELWPPCHTRFLDHTQRRATVGRTPPDE
jgi:hypothetical protein